MLVMLIQFWWHLPSFGSSCPILLMLVQFWWHIVQFWGRSSNFGDARPVLGMLVQFWGCSSSFGDSRPILWILVQSWGLLLRFWGCCNFWGFWCNFWGFWCSFGDSAAVLLAMLLLPGAVIPVGITGSFFSPLELIALGMGLGVEALSHCCDELGRAQRGQGPSPPLQNPLCKTRLTRPS